MRLYDLNDVMFLRSRGKRKHAAGGRPVAYSGVRHVRHVAVHEAMNGVRPGWAVFVPASDTPTDIVARVVYSKNMRAKPHRRYRVAAGVSPTTGEPGTFIFQRVVE